MANLTTDSTRDAITRASRMTDEVLAQTGGMLERNLSDAVLGGNLTDIVLGGNFSDVLWGMISASLLGSGQGMHDGNVTVSVHTDATKHATTGVWVSSRYS